MKVNENEIELSLYYVKGSLKVNRGVQSSMMLTGFEVMISIPKNEKCRLSMINGIDKDEYDLPLVSTTLGIGINH